jgi:hypothetical protein
MCGRLSAIVGSSGATRLVTVFIDVVFDIILFQDFGTLVEAVTD